MPLLRRDGRGVVAGGYELLRAELDLDGRRVALRLGQDTDDVVEVARGADVAVEPGRVARARAHGRARFAFGHQPAVHGGAHSLYAERDQRVVVVVVRIPERRREQHGARRTRLVVVVHDLRVPLLVHHPRHVLRLGLRDHIGVAVVVVPDVLLVEARDATGRALHGIGTAHVPAGDQLHAVRVGVGQERDHVVQEALGLVVVPAHHLVDHLHELVRAQHLGRVQATVDPHDGLALIGQVERFRIGQSLGQSESLGDPAVALSVRVILGRRDDGHQVRPTLGGPPDRVQHHPRRLGGELLPVFGELRVGRQEVVVSDVVA